MQFAGCAAADCGGRVSMSGQTVHYVDVELRPGGRPTPVNVKQFAGLRAIGVSGMAGVLSPHAQDGAGMYASGLELASWQDSADAAERTMTVRLPNDAGTVSATVPSLLPIQVVNVRLQGAVVTLTTDVQCGLTGYKTSTDDDVQLYLLRAGQPVQRIDRDAVVRTSPSSVVLQASALLGLLDAGHDLTEWQLLCTPIGRLTTLLQWLNAEFAQATGSVSWVPTPPTYTGTGERPVALLKGAIALRGGLATKLRVLDDKMFLHRQPLMLSRGQHSNPMSVASRLCAMLSGTTDPADDVALVIEYRYQKTPIVLPKGAVTMDRMAAYLSAKLQQVDSHLRVTLDGDGLLFQHLHGRKFSMHVGSMVVASLLGLRVAVYAGRSQYRSTFPLLDQTSAGGGFGVGVSASMDQVSNHLTLHAEAALEFPVQVEGDGATVRLLPAAPFTVVPVLCDDLLLSEDGVSWGRVLDVAPDGTSCEVEGYGWQAGAAYVRRAAPSVKMLTVESGDAMVLMGMPTNSTMQLDGLWPLLSAQSSTTNPTFSVILRSTHGLSSSTSGQIDRNSTSGSVQQYVNGVAIALVTPGQAQMQPFSCQPVPITARTDEIELYVQSSEEPVGQAYDLRGNRLTLRLMFVCA